MFRRSKLLGWEWRGDLLGRKAGNIRKADSGFSLAILIQVNLISLEN
jgi:hypothetical protein